MKRSVGILFFVVLFTFVAFNGYGQSLSTKNISGNLNYTIENWSKKDGLPTNSLLDICQTKDGYIWLASYSGLIKFDGYDFILYNKENTDVFVDNAINKFATGIDGTLYMTTSGSGLISYKDGQFTSILNDTTSNYIYYVIFIDSKNRIWGTSKNSGWFILENGKYTYLDYKIPLKDIELTCITEDKNGVIWIGTDSHGLFKYESGNLSNVQINNDLFNGWIGALYVDKNNVLWVGVDKLLYTFDTKKLLVNEMNSGYDITKIVVDNEDNMWIASWQGLLLKQAGSNSFIVLNEDNGLISNSIRALMIDNEDILWVVYYKGGLSKLKQSKFKCYTSSNGLSGNLTNTICEINPDEILVGFDDGLINKIKKGEISPFKTKTKLEGSRIRNIFKDSKGNLWISTYVGLLKISQDGSERMFSLDNDFPDKYIRMVFEDSKGNIWVATRNSGAIRINNDGSYSVFDKSSGLKANLVMSITEDKKGNIILGTSQGGLYFISDNKIVKHYSQQNGLTSDIIFNVYVDNKGIIWVAANYGLCAIIDDELITFPDKKGMLPGTPFDVLEDNFGYLWMPTTDGVMSVKKQELLDYSNGIVKHISCELYNTYDGLVEAECNSTANSLKASDGTLWFPSLSGLASIDPSNIKTNDYIPPVYVQFIKFDDSTVFNPKNVIIPAGSRRIVLNYSALSFYEPKENFYKYKLEGFDTSWSEITHERYISYTNLPPGEYTFKVIACNNDGLWNNEGTELHFKVNRQFYQTAFFLILIIVLAIIVLYLGYILRVKRLKNKQNKLEFLIEKRTAEITEKNDELRQQNEEIYVQSEQLKQLSMVVQETGNAVAVYDSKLTLLWANQAYARIYGYTGTDMFNLPQLHITKISPRKDILELVQQCIDSKNSVSYEVEKTNADNKQIWVQVTLTPIYVNQEFKQLIVVETDITEIKTAQIEITTQQAYITSSIKYAKSIQEAIFPYKENIDKYFDNFIVFKPKDIVSGDFYWFNTVNEGYFNDNAEMSGELINSDSCSFIALADCTGHGVPGAFMSMLGISLLNEIVNISKIYSPKDILTALNDNIRKLLKQDVSDNVEGMDIGLCMLRKKANNITSVSFSGAKLNLYYYNSETKDVEIIKGDRKSIGGVFFKYTQIDFTNYTVEMKKGDIFYLTSDGYLDQNNVDRRRYGTENFKNLLLKIAELGLPEQKQVIDLEYDNWKQNELQRDDITVIGIKV